MGKKFNHRATQQRREQAAAARKHQEDEKRSAFWAAHGQKLRLAAIVAGAAIAIALVWLLVSLLISAFNQPAEIKDLAAIEESWIVIDADPGLEKRYHHAASYIIPEGYTKSDYRKNSDVNQQVVQALANDPAAAVKSVYIDATVKKTAQAYADSTAERLKGQNPPPLKLEGAFTASIAGKDACCVYALCSAAEEQECASLYAAFSAPGNVCVYAILTSADFPQGQAPDCEAMLQQAQVLLAGLTPGE